MSDIERIRSEFREEIDSEIDEAKIAVEGGRRDPGSELRSMFRSASRNPLKKLTVFRKTMGQTLSDVLDSREFAEMSNAIDDEETIQKHLNNLATRPAFKELAKLWSAAHDGQESAGEMTRAFDDAVDDHAVMASTQQSLAMVLALAKRHAPAPTDRSGETPKATDNADRKDAVQKKGGAPMPAAKAHRAASAGVSGGGRSMPFAGPIQKAFGSHDISDVRAHTGTRAAEANRTLGSRAFATGNQVAFIDHPDLHTAAHEAAHVVQQRQGVSLPGGVGNTGDHYERHADAVADLVVQGRSAEALLNRALGAQTSQQSALQLKEDTAPKAGTTSKADKESKGDESGQCLLTDAQIFQALAYARLRFVTKDEIVGMQKVIGVKTDGRIGEDTIIAIAEWQKKNGMKADGIPGKYTQLGLGLTNTVGGTEGALAAGSETSVSAEATTEASKKDATIKDDEAKFIKTMNQLTSVYEGGKASGKYDALTPVNDGGIVSFGSHQATLASGSLKLILDKYLELADPSSANRKIIAANMARVRKKDKTLKKATAWKNALKNAAKNEQAMKDAQDVVFSKKYGKPAFKAAKKHGVTSVLGHAMLYDTNIQGGLSRLVNLTKKSLGGDIGDTVKGKKITELQFLKKFNQLRDKRLKSIAASAKKKGQKTRANAINNSRYRVRSFDELLKAGNLNVAGPKGKLKVLGPGGARVTIDSLDSAVYKGGAKAVGGKAIGTATVKATRLMLRSKPSRSGRRVDSLARGTTVNVLAEKGLWLKVEIAGVVGYLHRDFLSYEKNKDKPAVQKKGGAPMAADQAHHAASAGVSGGGGALPFASTIQSAFGAHDLSGVSAHMGTRAAQANKELGSRAYATGDQIAFIDHPDLHTAAHEAAHVIQQRQGVSLMGGVGAAGDSYERHADAVADRVVSGQSAEGLLDRVLGGSSVSTHGLQLKEHTEHTEEHGHGSGHVENHDDEHGHDGVHDDHKDAPYKPKYTGRGIIDLTSALSVSHITTVLDNLADEPGEYAELKFEIKASVKAGTGVVNGYLKGMAEIALQYYVSDQNMYGIKLDIEAALEAGVDLGGIIKAGVEVGIGFDLTDKSYKSPEDAAKSILIFLSKINDQADGKLFNLPDVTPNPEAEFSVHEQSRFIGANVEAEVGPIKGEVGYKEKMVDKTIHDGQHNEYKSSEHHKELHAQIKAKVKGLNLSLSYDRDWSNTVGSPIYYANGVFLKHSLAFGAQKKDILNLAGTKAGAQAAANGAENLVLGVFLYLQQAGIPFAHMASLNAKLFASIADKINQPHVKLDVGLKIRFVWHDYGESNGENRLMYFRVHVDTTVSKEMGANVGVAKIEGEASASKSEVVYEVLGAETVSYIQRQFIYATERRPWSAFVAKNKVQIDQLVKNVATEGFLYYEPSVAAAYGEGNAEKGLKALEAHWRAQDQELKKIKKDMGDFGRHYDKGTSIWTWRDSTQARHMRAMINLTKKHSDESTMLAFFMNQIPAYGMDMAEIDDLANEANGADDGTNYVREWQRLLIRAQDVAKAPESSSGGGHDKTEGHGGGETGGHDNEAGSTGNHSNSETGHTEAHTDETTDDNHVSDEHGGGSETKKRDVEPETITYKVKSGDTLSQIAKDFKVEGGYQALAKLNGLTTPDLIFVDQTIKLPKNKAEVPIHSAATSEHTVDTPHVENKPHSARGNDHATGHETGHETGGTGHETGGTGHGHADKTDSHSGGNGHTTDHTGGDHHIGEHDAHKPAIHKPKYSGQGILDLSKALSIDGIATVLDNIADEPGEFGEIKFELEAKARAGGGVVNGYVEGLLALAFQYYVSDQNMRGLKVEYEAAIGAGVDVLGIFSVGAEAGVGGDFVDKSYRSSKDAAKVLLMVLSSINDACGGKLMNLPEVGAEPQAAFDTHESRVSLGGKVGVDVGVASAEGSYKQELVTKTMHDANHNEYHSKEHHKVKAFEFETKIKGVSVKGNVSSDWSNTVGSPLYYANGVFVKDEYGLMLSRDGMLKAGGMKEAERDLKSGAKNLIMGAFMFLAGAGYGGPVLAKLNDKLFDTIVKQMRGFEKGKSIGLNFGVGVRIVAHYYGESNGENRLMYFRVHVDERAALETEIKGGVVEFAGGVSQTKSEVVYESLGSETVSYIQRQFVYQTKDRPWKAFLAQNRPAINGLVKNMATEGFLYYVPEVKAAFGPGEDYDKGLKAVEAHWLKLESDLKAIKVDMGEFGKHYSSGTSAFTWRDTTQRNHMRAMIEIAKRHANQPKIMAFFMEQIPAFGMNMKEIDDLALEANGAGDGRNYVNEWNRLLLKAEQGRTEKMPEVHSGGSNHGGSEHGGNDNSHGGGGGGDTKKVPGAHTARFRTATGLDVSGVTLTESPKLAQQGHRGAAISGRELQVAPGHTDDPLLIAHELTHIAQQRGGSPGAHARELSVQALEAEAVRAAAAITHGQPVTIRGRTSATVLYEASDHGLPNGGYESSMSEPTASSVDGQHPATESVQPDGHQRDSSPPESHAVEVSPSQDLMRAPAPANDGAKTDKRPTHLSRPFRTDFLGWSITVVPRDHPPTVRGTQFWISEDDYVYFTRLHTEIALGKTHLRIRERGLSKDKRRLTYYPGFREKVLKGIRRLMRTPTGRQLIEGVANGGFDAVVMPTEDPADGRSRNWADGEDVGPTDSTILLDPRMSDTSATVFNEAGKPTSMPFYILLGHELIHSRRSQRGARLPAASDEEKDLGISSPEEAAVINGPGISENRLRRENGLERRVGWNGKKHDENRLGPSGVRGNAAGG